jgi:hypothetical protein
VTEDVNNPKLTVQLPLGLWQVALAHLFRGTFQEVAAVIQEIHEQLGPQVAAAVAAQQAKIIEEARNVVAEAAAQPAQNLEPPANGKELH